MVAIQHTQAMPHEVFFWRTHQGAELDLLIVRGRKRLAFEVKRTAAPSITPSMRFALADLKLKSLTVVQAGVESFALSKNIHAVACVRLSISAQNFPPVSAQ